MPHPNFHLNSEQLAGLFTRLARLETSGIPAAQGLQILAQSEAKLRKPILLMATYLKSGLSVSAAGFKAGIFNDTLKTLIHAAEHSGQLAGMYARLADHYTRQNARKRKIKSRLYLPVLTAIIALFVNPLPALVSGSITTLEYVQLSLGRLLLAGFCIAVLINLPKIAYHLGIEKSWHRLQLKLPLIHQWVLRRQINEFFFILELMLESGLAFADGLPKAVATIKNGELRNYFKPALSITGSGASVSETLAKVPVIDTPLLNVLNSSEQSGKLPSGISHFVKLEAETIELQNEALAEWIPRLAYFLIAVWIAYSIVGGSTTRLIFDQI